MDTIKLGRAFVAHITLYDPFLDWKKYCALLDTWGGTYQSIQELELAKEPY